MGDFDNLRVRFSVTTVLRIPKNKPLTVEILHESLMEYLQYLAENNNGSEFLANLTVKPEDIEPLESRYD